MMRDVAIRRSAEALALVKRTVVLPAMRQASVVWEHEPSPGDTFEPRASLRRPAIAGISAIVIGFGGFLLWSVTATIDSAAVASGVVIVDFEEEDDQPP